jgi:hypothetical protein
LTLLRPGVTPEGCATCAIAQIKASDPARLSPFHR